ncbi:MAG: class I SAM-dependent DNA methyltransferase, partial [Alphaproteobacteria bacterium]|nr:class I SAM-dependent DNA methyltransferase [Alphaproteobacteria bacterium]
TNEARGKAAVFCVIIGFGLQESGKKRLFEYEEVDGEPHEIVCEKINPYLADAENVIISGVSKPLWDCPPMINGSKPADGGNLLLDEKEKQELIAAEKSAEKWIRPYSMGNEFINGIPRFCLWLKNCPPQELRKMPLVMERVKAVKKFREKSPKKHTRDFAKTPAIFVEDRDVESPSLAIPRVSTANRAYIPIGYLSPDYVVGDTLYTVPNATLYEFGVLTSLMHMSWMRAVCGRLESRYRYSARVVYNNFPWPQNPAKKQTETIKTAAQAVLDARATYPDSTLADLYDPITMPAELLKAHQTLDTATDRAYRPAPFPNESTRVAHLFTLHQARTAPVVAKKKRGR